MSGFCFTNITSSKDGYEQIGDFYKTYKDAWFESIHISLNKWFDANMCAALGGVLNDIATRNNIIISSDRDSILQTLRKNNFLSSYGYRTALDSYNTTAQYLKLDPAESKYFSSYIYNELLSKSVFSTVSDTLKNEIVQSIYEIFVNAQTHSGTEYIYTCGQFFPKKRKIVFSIADTGAGFHSTVGRRFGVSITSLQAIRWALEHNNTTKMNAPGGIGLSMLRDFIHRNGGKLQIASYEGFYEADSDERYTKLYNLYPGTVVNMEFRTDSTGVATYNESARDIF